MRSALPFLLVLALAGCKGSREKEVVGNWTLPGGQLTIAEDKSYRGQISLLTLEGTWAMEGDDVTLTRTRVNGKPVAEIKAQLQRSLAAVPAARRGAIDAMVNDLDKPSVLTLSADGKTLTTNKAKDKSQGPGITLTKS